MKLNNLVLVVFLFLICCSGNHSKFQESNLSPNQAAYFFVFEKNLGNDDIHKVRSHLASLQGDSNSIEISTDALGEYTEIVYIVDLKTSSSKKYLETEAKVVTQSLRKFFKFKFRVFKGNNTKSPK